MKYALIIACSGWIATAGIEPMWAAIAFVAMAVLAYQSSEGELKAKAPP